MMMIDVKVKVKMGKPVVQHSVLISVWRDEGLHSTECRLLSVSSERVNVIHY